MCVCVCTCWWIMIRAGCWLAHAFHCIVWLAVRFGLQGRLAYALATLAHVMYGGTCVELAPGHIKALISERDDAFRGMGQQDAHEVIGAEAEDLLVRWNCDL